MSVIVNAALVARFRSVTGSVDEDEISGGVTKAR
jgi:hypothetical protein